MEITYVVFDQLREVIANDPKWDLGMGRTYRDTTMDERREIAGYWLGTNWDALMKTPGVFANIKWLFWTGK
jgi:hypothetical protein